LVLLLVLVRLHFGTELLVVVAADQVALVVLFLVLALAIPQLRAKVFPYRGKRVPRVTNAALEDK